MYSVEKIVGLIHEHVCLILGNQHLKPVATPLNRPTIDDVGSTNNSNHVLDASAKTNNNRIAIGLICLSICAVAPMYGAMMGSFGWLAGERSFTEQMPQVTYSAVKMPLLVLTTVAICIPSFFVFNRVAGLQKDFPAAINAIVSSLASFAIVLLSLAPFTGLFYVSIATHSAAYQLATLFNAVMFGVAAVSSQFVLLKSYRRLIEQNRRHAQMLIVWVSVFAFVGIQFGWTLRPFIGDPNQAISFVRDEPMSNAYIQLIKIARTAMQ